MEQLVRYATLAANSHNTQPWIFETTADSIRIRPDPSRRCQVVDPEDRHLTASLGCATQNLDLAARAAGLNADIAFEPATRSVVAQLTDRSSEASPSFEAIPERQSTRAPFDPAPLPNEILRRLESAAKGPGVRVRVLTDRGDLSALKDFVIAGNTAQCNNPEFTAELRDWVRFNQTHAAETRDGLYVGTSGNPATPRWLGRTLFPFVFTPGSENPRYVAQLDGSAGAVVLFAEHDEPEGWFAVGRASQRFQLQATVEGVRTSFVNQPVEVPDVRPEFANWLREGLRPALVLRFGLGPKLEPSLRRPVSAVLRVAAA